MVWLGSDARREAIAAGVRSNDPDPSAIRATSWHLVRTWVIGLAAPLALAAALVYTPGHLWRPVGDLLLGAARRGMAGALHLAYWLGWLA